MKKLLILVVAFLTAGLARAQFEGTIRWSMQMEVTDPATKAKMEEAKNRANDPAQQAKMKEMQEKMNDPKMKAMMDANPAMKEQMENVMKMAQSGDMSSMMPKGMILRIKDQNIWSTMDGGPMAMEMLYLKAKDQSYRIDRNAKTYTVLNSSANPQHGAQEPPKVTKTSETRKILNFNCTKYLVEMKEGPRTTNETIWATTEIKDIDFKALAKQKIGRGQSFMADGVDGVPLRVEMTSQEGNMTMEVTEIKKESLPSADFTIPSDFKEAPMGMYGKY